MTFSFPDIANDTRVVPLSEAKCPVVTGIVKGENLSHQLDKRRPAVIFRAVPWLNEIHIVPITSSIRGLRSEIEIFGLPKASEANAQRLMLLPKAQLVRRVGSVPEQVMDGLTGAICVVLSC